MPSKVKEIAKADKTAVLTGVGMAIGGSVVAAWAHGWPDSWEKTAVLAIATTALSIGTLAIFFELQLRRSVFTEMAALAGLSRKLERQALDDAGTLHGYDWSTFFQHSTDMHILLRDAHRWTEAQLSTVFETMRRRPVKAVFYLPDMEADYFDTLAESLDFDTDDLRKRGEDAISNIEKYWEAFDTKKNIRSGSSLEVRLLERIPLYDLFITDSMLLISFGGPGGSRAADPHYYYLHVGEETDHPFPVFSGFLSDMPSKRRFERVAA